MAEDDFDNIFDSEEWREFAERARTEMVPKLAGSALSVTLYGGHFDAKLAIELGAAILLDKPIVVLLEPNSVCPPKLRRIAEAVLVFDPEDPVSVRECMEMLVGFKEHPTP